MASGFLKPWDSQVWPQKKWDQPENVNSVKSPKFSGGSCRASVLIRWGSMGFLLVPLAPIGAPCPKAMGPHEECHVPSLGGTGTTSEPKHLEAGTNRLNQPILTGMYKSYT